MKVWEDGGKGGSSQWWEAHAEEVDGGDGKEQNERKIGSNFDKGMKEERMSCLWL